MRLDRAAALAGASARQGRGAASSPTARRRGPRTCSPAVLDGRSRARWRWSRPSGPRRWCCCKMVADVDRDLPVLMIDSQMLFAETLDYQRDAVAASGPAQRPASAARPEDLRAVDPDDTLHQRDTDACCDVRKVRAAASGRCGAGRLRSRGASASRPRRRAALEVFEARRRAAARSTRWPTGPSQDLRDYMDENDLPRHPLVARGLPVDRLRALHDAGRARARTSAPAAGAAARRSSAASTSAPTAASCGRRADGTAMTRCS